MTTNTNAREVYDAWHRRLDVDAEADSPWHRLIKARLRACEDLGDKRILEIGCGRGGFACWLARAEAKPRQVVGCDFSPAAVAIAEKFATNSGCRNARWLTCDIQRTPFDDDEFDTVISTETIEHVPEPGQAVRELARVLKRGGRLYLSTPNYLSTIGLLRIYRTHLRRIKWDESGQPIVNWTMFPRTIRWIKRAGLRIVECDSSGHYLPCPRRSPIRLDHLARPHSLLKWFGHHSLVVAEKPVS